MSCKLPRAPPPRTVHPARPRPVPQTGNAIFCNINIALFLDRLIPLPSTRDPGIKFSVLFKSYACFMGYLWSLRVDMNLINSRQRDERLNFGHITLIFGVTCL